MRNAPLSIRLLLVSGLTVFLATCGPDGLSGEQSASTMELKGGNKGGGGGKGKVSPCSVSPNPVEQGATFTISATELSASWPLRVDIQDVSATQSFDAAAGPDGVLSLDASSDAVGPGRVFVYRLMNNGRTQLRSTCEFEVVVPCTPTTCEALAADCGLQDDGCGGTLDCGPCPTVCGDGNCDPDEDCASCEADCGACGPTCGDTVCEEGEDCASCEADCGACAPFCGDGSCDPDEDCTSCEADCGACAPFCGDGSCDPDEDCGSCENDCGPCGGYCGDGYCDGNGGESCTACGSDCDTTAEVCGNGACQSGEDSSSCYGDCGPSTWNGSWAQWEEEVVALINQERAAGTDCPSSSKNPVGPLTMHEQLRTASRLHSWDQSYSGYFSHTSCNGRSPWQRAADAGTSASAETIGGGYSSPASMVQGWMNSSGHCNILMGGGYSSVGVGFAQPNGRIWTAMFR